MESFYVGNQLVNNQAQAERKTWSLTTSQSVFPIRYDTGDVDVYKNGQKLRPGLDYTVNLVTRDSITLAIAGVNGDFIEIIGWNGYSILEPAKYIRTRYNFTAVAPLSVYNCNYQANSTDVFVNGVKMVLNDDYTGIDGTSITLAVPLGIGDTLEVCVYESFSVVDINAKLAQNQSFTRTDFIATAGQTTFSVNYTPGFLQVYHNGVLLQPADYTATSGTSVVLGVAAALSDEVSVLTWSVFSVGNTVQKTGDTMTGNLNMGANKVVSSAAPTTGNDLANKTYVDSYFPVSYANLSTGVTNGGFGHKNFLFNGAMEVSQRFVVNTTTALTNARTYYVDRWAVHQNTTASGWVKNANYLSEPMGGTNFLNCLNLSRAAASASTNGIYAAQVLETIDSARLRGKTVTISFWAKGSADFISSGAQALVNLVTSTGVDQSMSTFSSGWAGVAIPVNQNFSITNVWARYSFTATLGSTITQVGVQLGYTPVGTAGAAETISITGVQLEIGSQATEYEYRSYGQELALCQRYCFAFTGAMGRSLGTGALYNGNIRLPVTMRITPSLATVGTFTVTAGSAGTPAVYSNVGVVNSENNVAVYNSAGNWTAGNDVSLNGAVFSAEL